MRTNRFSILAPALLWLLPLPALAFSSGGTDANGPFNPNVNTELQLPASGVFNFTSVNIPAGVTVKFRRNATNTPVVILATGDVIIAGTIDISGSSAASAGAAGDGNIGDDGVPGTGGPGGYDGGRGGQANYARGGSGIGPGAGQPGIGCGPGQGTFSSGIVVGGVGGSFGAVATAPSTGTLTCSGITLTEPQAAPKYGSELLLPLVGGSGGGGAGGGAAFVGAGGGGAGGAILIAASGTVNITGSLLANGGKGGDTAGAGAGGTGGGGSGGAIRIMATTIAGNGAVSAVGGAAGTRGTSSSETNRAGTAGAVGRIRFEASSFNRTAATTPAFPPVTPPEDVFVAGLPSLHITRVAGIGVPAQPTGNGDVVLPTTTPNPVTVEFATTGVPVGNTVKLTVTPPSGLATNAISGALAGTTANATASASISLPSGPSILSAQTTYTIVASLGDALSRYAQGERVEKVRLGAVLGGQPSVTLITVSGKEYDAPQAVLAGFGG